jgi:hypothetical protein
MDHEIEPTAERYRGRPLLLVLEHYVLAAIGEMPDDKRAEVAVFVQTALGGGDDWMLTVREKLHFHATMDEELREVWAKNRALAREHGLDLQPDHFAQLLVDENFTPLIDRAPDL